MRSRSIAGDIGGANGPRMLQVPVADGCWLLATGSARAKRASIMN